jgi:S-adenosylmethionine:tRNA ribosyltransferase-isomerase
LHPQNLPISDFDYALPDDRIARYPVQPRDSSKLLQYKSGNLTDYQFTDLPALLPAGTTLLLNQSKVIPARLRFVKPTGGAIEVFCLNPDARYASIEEALVQKGEVWWHCLVGGASKWKGGQRLQLSHNGLTLHATGERIAGAAFRVHFQWDHPALNFLAVLQHFGDIPLPPYLGRSTEATDAETYQTVFAQAAGSVAAPTASLHFTEAVLEALRRQGTQIATTTLHVGAGTFQPVKSENMAGHAMHAEWMEIDIPLVEKLLAGISAGPVIPVGTTALRTLESLYWIGAKLARRNTVNFAGEAVTQWEPYEPAGENVLPREALEALLHRLQKEGGPIRTRTAILIAPGYRFQLAGGLVTNFHQPHSTLLLLIAALVGPAWKTIYNYALENGYRFLSYGDSSLLLKG